MMMISSGGGLPSIGSTGGLQKTNRALSRILERLSTGMRINRASDDAAGLAISEQLRSSIRGFKMAGRNIEDALSTLNISDGAANEMSSILQRQRELAIQARNGTLTDEQRQGLDTEYQQLTAELDRIASSTQFNRQQTADGTELGSGTAQIQAGAEAGDQVALPNVDFTAASLGVAGTSIADSMSADSAISALDSAIGQLGSQRTTIGAAMNRFSSARSNLEVAEVNTQAAESLVRDHDMAVGLSRLSSERLLQESSLHVQSRFNQISAQNIASLLQ